MPSPKHKTVQQQATDWPLRLLWLLQQMAENNTNAVLMLLADVGQLETERHYPAAGLLFGSGRWRAYYHCHEAEAMHADEHGHFHLFTATDTQAGDQAWAHVAGLSIDSEGQPLQWFAVNRWVTDGPWLAAETFHEQLNYISPDDAEQDLVAGWLAVLLQLYREPLYELLCARDRRIAQLSKAGSSAETLENRALYSLAVQAVDVQSTLEAQLIQPGEYR
jgi:hypothetical protein